MNRAKDSQPRAMAVGSDPMKRGIIFVASLACAAAVAGAPVKIERNSKVLEFSYAWPAEAAAVPALDRRFRLELDKALKEELANAHEDQALARTQKRPFNQHAFSMQWTTAGQTPRLLSLQNQLATFEGGAHPVTNYNALLWDRRQDRQVSFGALFTRSGAFMALTRTAYCKALNAERARRREGMKLELAEFNECPKYTDLAIAPVDKNSNGRFDTIDFVASPYVAGPYVEGEYDIHLPVTRQLIAAIQPGYRASFEAQRQ
jgi:hypothetical protein